MSVRVVRWAFVSGHYAHLWADGDQNDEWTKAYASSLCGNRSEKIVTIEGALRWNQPSDFRRLCPACQRKAPKHLVMKPFPLMTTRTCPNCGGSVAECQPREGRCGRLVDDLALAWPDDA